MDAYDTTLALTTFLPITIKLPGLVAGRDDIDEDPMLLKAWDLYCSRRERAYKSYIKAMIIEYENHFTIQEILDALALAECWYIKQSEN